MEINRADPHQVIVQQQSFDDVDDEIDLRELFGILWAEKWQISGVTVAAAVISLTISLTMTETYRAEAVLAAADTEQNVPGLSSQLGGAAALLGVSIGGNIGDQITTAITTLRSRQFVGRFIEENNLLVPLFAARWNKATKDSRVDDEIYDVESGKWTRSAGAPTQLEAYREFSEILSVEGPDRNTGIVTLAIEWHNPIEASDWVNRLVTSINNEVKARDVREANNAIAYLRTQLEATQLVDMQRVFYQLIESQTRITMLADVRDEYVFRIIDPAVVPDRKAAPQRALICLIGTLAGGLLSILIVFGRRLFAFRK